MHLVILYFLIFVLACTNRESQTQSYIKPIVDPVNTLDPSKTRFRTDYMTTRAIQGQLLSLGPFGQVKPALVESWEVNKEGTLYLLRVRRNVKFHSGKIADARDVAFTLHYLAGKDSLINQLFIDIEGFNEFTSGKSEGLSGVVVLDPQTVQVRLSSPSFVFLVALADPKVAVVPDKLDGKSAEEFFQRPNGIGPFKIKNFKSGQEHLELTANHEYFLNKAKIEKITLKKMSQKDAEREFTEHKIHDLELYTIPLSSHKRLAAISNQYSVSAYSTSFIFFNGLRKVFRKLETRKALASALDVNQLIQKCDVPYVKSTGFIPHGIMGWADPKYIVEKSNPHKSRKIREIFGPSHPPLVFVSYGNENNNCVIDGLVSQLKSAGVPVKHERLTQDQIITRLEARDYDLFFEHLSVRSSEPYHLLTYFDPRSRHNLIAYNDPWISTLSDRIKTAPASQVRTSLYRQLDLYMSDEKTYFIPVFSDIRHYFFSREVHGPTIPAIILMNNGFEEIWLK